MPNDQTTSQRPIHPREVEQVIESVVQRGYDSYAKVEKACPICFAKRMLHPAVGFPICESCTKQWGPMTHDQRVLILNGKPVSQVMRAKGMPTHDRVHVPQLFTNAQASPEIAEWARKPMNFTIVLYGPTGTGKSYQASAALREVLRTRHGQGYLINCAGLSRMGRDEFKIYSECFILAMDDFGAKLTPVCMASAYELVEARTSNRRPLIVTTNANPEDLRAIDDRIDSRLSAGLWFQMSGVDRRISG